MTEKETSSLGIKELAKKCRATIIKVNNKKYNAGVLAGRKMQEEETT